MSFSHFAKYILISKYTRHYHHMIKPLLKCSVLTGIMIAGILLFKKKKKRKNSIFFTSTIIVNYINYNVVDLQENNST